jgi:hypothetical protein
LHRPPQLDPIECEYRLFAESLSDRGFVWRNRFFFFSLSLPTQSGLAPAPIQTATVELATAVGDQAAEPMIARSARDSASVSLPEFLRYTAWFGFSNTVSPFVQNARSNPAARIPALVWLQSVGVVHAMGEALTVEWVLCLDQRPGEFAPCGDDDLPVRFDAVRDIFSVGERERHRRRR